MPPGYRPRSGLCWGRTLIGPWATLLPRTESASLQERVLSHDDRNPVLN